jgi:hypothetical protein
MAGDSKNQSYNNKDSYKVWYFKQVINSVVEPEPQ